LEPSLAALKGKFPLLKKLECIGLPGLRLENIEGFSNLKELRITGDTSLSALPPSFSQLTALETLELLNFDGLTKEGLAPLKHLKQLKHLPLENWNFCRDFSYPEWNCNNVHICLEHLSLYDNDMSFPPSISNFKHLTSLSIQYTSDDVPESIGTLFMLQKLDLSNEMGPIALPFSVSKLTALKNLHIWIDEEGLAPLQHLTWLTELKLEIHDDDDDPIREYPEFIWNFTSLKALCLTGEGQRLPDAVGNLKNLESLELTSNYDLTTISESVGNLSHSTGLSFKDCPELPTLPESVGNLVALQKLDLDDCPTLTFLPESIGNLKNLNVIDLMECTVLTTLPLSIGKLESLERLAVSDCPLIELPESVGDLHALKRLEINRCTLTSIPDSIGDLNCRKARKEEGSAMEMVCFTECPKLVLSREIQHAKNFGVGNYPLISM